MELIIFRRQLGWMVGEESFSQSGPTERDPYARPSSSNRWTVDRSGLAVANAIRCAFPAPHKVRDHNYASNSEIYYILPSIWWQDCRLQYNCNKDRQIKSPNSIGIIYNCPVRGMLILSSVMGTLPSAVVVLCCDSTATTKRWRDFYYQSLYYWHLCA